MASILELKRARFSPEGVWHILEGDHPLPAVGDSVHGLIDWDRRYQVMRTHTAMHVLCGTIFRDFSALVTGGDMEPLRGRMDFEFENLHKDLVQVIEESVNAEIEKAHEVRTKILPREEAFQIPDLIRTKINLLPPSIKEVRTVRDRWAGPASRWRHACAQYKRSWNDHHSQLQKQRQD